MIRLSIGTALLMFVMDAICIHGRTVATADKETVTWTPQLPTESLDDENYNVTYDDNKSKPPCLSPVFSSTVTELMNTGVYETFMMYFDVPNQRVAVHGLPDGVTEIFRGFEDQSLRGIDYYQYSSITKTCQHTVISDEKIKLPCVPDIARLTTKVKAGASTFQLWTIPGSTPCDYQYLLEDVTGYPVVTSSLANSPFTSWFNCFSEFVTTVDPTKFDLPPICNGTDSQIVTGEQLVNIRRKLQLLPGRSRNLTFLQCSAV